MIYYTFIGGVKFTGKRGYLRPGGKACVGYGQTRGGSPSQQQEIRIIKSKSAEHEHGLKIKLTEGTKQLLQNTRKLYTLTTVLHNQIHESK